MAQSDEVGLSNADALELTHTQLNRVNEHTLLLISTRTEPEAEPKGKANEDDGKPGENMSKKIKPRSYYGNHIMGPAVRSTYNQRSFPVAVSFAVDEDVNDLILSFILTTWDINIPQISLNEKEFSAFQDDVPARSQTPAFSLADNVLPVET